MCSESAELKSNWVYLAIVAVCQSGRATPCHTETNQSRQDDHLTVHGFIRVQSNTFNTVRFTQSLPHNHNTLQDFRSTHVCVQTRLMIHAEREDPHLQGWKVRETRNQYVLEKGIAIRNQAGHDRRICFEVLRPYINIWSFSLDKLVISSLNRNIASCKLMHTFKAHVFCFSAAWDHVNVIHIIKCVMFRSPRSGDTHISTVARNDRNSFSTFRTPWRHLPTRRKYVIYLKSMLFISTKCSRTLL